MSKQRYPWWGYVKGMIYRYAKRPGEKWMPPCVDLTDRNAIREYIRSLPVEKREVEAVRFAIHETMGKPAGEERLQVVRRVLMDKTHTLDGAAYLVPCHYKTAQQWQSEFIKLVAWYFTLVE